MRPLVNGRTVKHEELRSLSQEAGLLASGPGFSQRKSMKGYAAHEYRRIVGAYRGLKERRSASSVS
jgi:hypothetical protein